MAEPTGVVAVLTDPNGVALATVADFDRSTYGGYTLAEGQELRVRRAISRAFIDRACSEMVARVIEQHHADEIVRVLCRSHGFRLKVIHVGGEKEP